MTSNSSGPDDARDYLWDPSAPADPSVASVERALAPLQFDQRKKALSLPPAPRRAVWRRPVFAIAASVTLVAIGTAAFWLWRQSWPAGRAWPLVVQQSASGGSASNTLALDQPFQLGAQSSARVEIARIGEMVVDPDSALTLVETSSRRHRLSLDRGSVHVRVWAPPGHFSIRTPAGTAIDLGCIFTLNVDAAGTATVHMQTGWIQLYNAWGESLIPAGTVATMDAVSPPSVPVFDDAPEPFKTSAREFQRTTDDGVRMTLVAEMARTARARDVLTLLMLAKDASPQVKRALLDRAATLRPPPDGMTVDDVLANRERLWDWSGSLGLPPPKSWWLNWRDFFSRLDR